MCKVQQALMNCKENGLHLGRAVDYNDLHSLYLFTDKEREVAEVIVVNNNTEAKFDLTLADIKMLIKHLEYAHDELSKK